MTHDAPRDLPAFQIAGLQIRTSFAEESSPATSNIAPLWDRFLHTPDSRIPNALEPDVIYSLYTNYESNELGAYDVVLGKAISNSSNLPGHLTPVTIPAARYLIFRAEDQTPPAIQAAWKNVYQHFAQPGKWRRAFTIDYDKYSPAGVELHIAITA